MLKYALLLALCGSAFAQENVVVYSQGSCCHSSYRDGIGYYTIEDPYVVVTVGAPQNMSARLHAVYVKVRQKGEINIDVNPANFVAAADDSTQTALPYADWDMIVEHDRKHRSLMVGLLNGLAAGAAGAAAAQPQTATVSNSNGTSSTITYTDPNAVSNANAASSAKARSDQALINAQYGASLSGVLRRNTLGPGKTVAGLVYFQGPKGMKATKKGFTPLLRVDIVLNGVTYRF